MDTQTLHRQSIVIDGHCDTLLRLKTQEQGMAAYLPELDVDRGHVEVHGSQKCDRQAAVALPVERVRTRAGTRD